MLRLSSLRISLLTLLLGLLAQFPGDQVFAQEASATNATAADDEPQIREQTIYIPYNRLKSLFEKEGRGVFIPYEQFQTLWKPAREKLPTADDVTPPLRSLITEIDSRASISEDVMQVDAELKIDLLDDGWHEIALRLNQSAISEARIDGETARLQFEANRGYYVLLQNDTDAPKTVTLSLRYAQAYQKSPGKNFLEFLAPQAPINRWRIEVPEEGVDIDVQPNIASRSIVATEDVDPSVPNEDESPEDDTASIMQAFVGGADRVRVEWTAKAEGAAGLSALVTVQTRQQVTIEEGVIRTRAHLIYDITRSDIETIEIQVPADHNVVNVFDPNLQRWEKVLEGDVQTLKLYLFQPTRGTQPVVIELEKFAGGKEMSRPMMQTEIVAPVIRATRTGLAENQVNVGRQQGIVVVKVDNSLRGETTNRSGLTQIDPADLPSELAGQPWTFAYRYAAVPFDLRLSVEKLLPEIDAEQLVETFIQPEKITAILTAGFDIKRAGVFQVELLVPRDYEVRSVQGVGIGDRQAFVVDNFNLADETDDSSPTRRLVINLAKRALGKHALLVRLDNSIDDVNLAQPTGESSSIPVLMPHVNPDRVNSSRGTLVVYGPESLRLTPTASSGVTAISNTEAFRSFPSQRGGRFSTVREIGFFAFTQQDVDLQYDAQRRKPYIEARQFLTVNVDSGVATFASNLQFDVRYSGIDTLRIDVPDSLASELNNDSPSIQDRVIDPQPDDVPEGYTAWSLSGDSELLGTIQAKFSWKQDLGELPVGTTVPIEVPRIIAQNVDRSWGQILASKAETIEVSVGDAVTGLRPIDPQRDLMPGFTGQQAARVFEYYGDWDLTLQATRYELEEVKRTSIDLAVLRMVVTRSEETSIQALYRLRSARQRIAVVIPGIDPSATENSLDSQPLKLNGQPALLEHDGTQFFIPYTGFSPDESVLVELRYTLPAGNAAVQLEVPQFPEDPAVQQVYVSAYLPEDQQLLFVEGPWNDESEFSLWEPEPWDLRSDDELLAEIRQGVNVSSIVASDFPVDGRRVLFSTLRPREGTEGALQLFAVKRLAIHTGVVLLVALCGIALCFRPLSNRLWWLALLAVGVIVASIFAPRLAQAVWSEPFFITLGLVIGLWVLQIIVSSIPKIGRWLKEALRPIPGPQLAASDGSAAASSVSASEGSNDAGASSTGQDVMVISEEESPPDGGSTSSNDDSKENGSSKDDKEGDNHA